MRSTDRDDISQPMDEHRRHMSLQSRVGGWADGLLIVAGQALGALLHGIFRH